ncbi:MAG: hypothetical protein MJE68_22005, partial [Proteobacteria bacterium]|nr:hypothetical protein [Pseudomonadota bacterium]
TMHAWGGLPTLEIFYCNIRILNHKLWSLPSQPVSLIELLFCSEFNFICSYMILAIVQNITHALAIFMFLNKLLSNRGCEEAIQLL